MYLNLRKCIKCKLRKPATAEHFNTHGRKSLRRICRDCEEGAPPIRLIVLNLQTNTAQTFEAIPEGKDAMAIPTEPEAYGAFVRAAQDAGYTVCIEG